MHQARAAISWSERDVVPIVSRAGSEAFALESETEDDRAWARAIRTLDGFTFLDADWDGYGAVAPDLELLNCARRFLAHLRQRKLLAVPSRILPTQDGGVLFEWQTSEIYLEAEIVDVGRIEWMYKSGDEPAIHREWSFPGASYRDDLAWTLPSHENDDPWLNVTAA